MDDLYRRALATATKHAYTSVDVAGEPMMLAVAHAQRVSAMAEEIGRLREAVEKCRQYVRTHHEGSGWWRDPAAYELIREYIDPALGIHTPSRVEQREGVK